MPGPGARRWAGRGGHTPLPAADTPTHPRGPHTCRCCGARPGPLRQPRPSVRPSLRPAPTFRPPPPPRSLRGAAPRRGAVRGRAGPRGDKALTYVGVAEGLLRVDGRAAARVGRAGPAEQQHRQPGQQAGQRGPGHRAAAAAQRRVPESLIHRRPGRAAHPPIRRRKVWVRRRGPPSGFAGAAAAAALRCLLWRCFLPLAAAKPRFLMCSGDSLLLLCMARGQPVSAPAPRRIRLRAELSPPARPGPARASRHGRGPSAVHPGRCLGADGAAQRRDRAGSAPGVGRRHGTRARLTALAPGPRRAEQQIAGRAALCLCPSISSPSCSSSSSPPAAPLPPPPPPAPLPPLPLGRSRGSASPPCPAALGSLPRARSTPRKSAHPLLDAAGMSVPVAQLRLCIAIVPTRAAPALSLPRGTRCVGAAEPGAADVLVGTAVLWRCQRLLSHRAAPLTSGGGVGAFAL